MKNLLDIYYKGFAEKANWGSVIADDFRYTGGDITKQEALIGKQAYIEVIKRFSQVFTVMRVKEMIIQGDLACVIGNYDFRFLSGQNLNGNVAEHWTPNNGKQKSPTIYFDTLTFANNTKR